VAEESTAVREDQFSLWCIQEWEIPPKAVAKNNHWIIWRTRRSSTREKKFWPLLVFGL